MYDSTCRRRVPTYPGDAGGRPGIRSCDGPEGRPGQRGAQVIQIRPAAPIARVYFRFERPPDVLHLRISHLETVHDLHTGRIGPNQSPQFIGRRLRARSGWPAGVAGVEQVAHLLNKLRDIATLRREQVPVSDGRLAARQPRGSAAHGGDRDSGVQKLPGFALGLPNSVLRSPVHLHRSPEAGSRCAPAASVQGNARPIRSAPLPGCRTIRRDPA